MTDEQNVTASELCGSHVGMEAHLPGRLDRDNGRWVLTWAPITMIQHKRDGSVKVRRHPDSHVDHTLTPVDLLSLRTPPGVATGGDPS